MALVFHCAKWLGDFVLGEVVNLVRSLPSLRVLARNLEAKVWA